MQEGEQEAAGRQLHHHDAHHRHRGLPHCGDTAHGHHSSAHHLFQVNNDKVDINDDDDDDDETTRLYFYTPFLPGKQWLLEFFYFKVTVQSYDDNCVQFDEIMNFKSMINIKCNLIKFVHEHVKIVFSLIEFMNYEVVKKIILLLNVALCLSYPVNFAIYCGMSRY